MRRKRRHNPHPESNEEFMDRQLQEHGRIRVRFTIEIKDQGSPHIWRRWKKAPMYLEFQSVQGAVRRIDALKAWFRALAPGWTAPREEPEAMPRIRFTPPPGFKV